MKGTRIVKSIRGIPYRPLKKLSTRDRKIAEYRSRKLQQERWENDKKIVRGHNFEKAKRGLAQYQEALRAEKNRKKALYEQRIANLEKARKNRWKNHQAITSGR